jgi:uncharacterized membrane protein HdeD (DUF308 family)
MLMTLARNWWTLALRGVCAVIFGILAFVWPNVTVQALVLLYGFYAGIDGVFAIMAAVSKREGGGMPWWALLLEGLLGVAAAVVAFTWPGITWLVLFYLIAAWAIVTGVLEIIAAFRLRKEIEGEWWYILSGLLSIVFGVLLIAQPAAGTIAIIWLIGSYAIMFGIVMILLAFKLKGFKDRFAGRFANA